MSQQFHLRGGQAVLIEVETFLVWRNTQNQRAIIFHSECEGGGWSKSRNRAR